MSVSLTKPRQPLLASSTGGRLHRANEMQAFFSATQWRPADTEAWLHQERGDLCSLRELPFKTTAAVWAPAAQVSQSSVMLILQGRRQPQTLTAEPSSNPRARWLWFPPADSHVWCHWPHLVMLLLCMCAKAQLCSLRMRTGWSYPDHFHPMQHPGERGWKNIEFIVNRRRWLSRASEASQVVGNTCWRRESVSQ